MKVMLISRVSSDRMARLISSECYDIVLVLNTVFNTSYLSFRPIQLGFLSAEITSIASVMLHIWVEWFSERMNEES